MSEHGELVTQLTPELDCRVVIISKDRSGVIVDNAFRLFPNATVFIGESETDDYVEAGIPEDQIVTHKDNITGIAPVKQAVLDTFDEEVVVIVDDDVSKIRSLIGVYSGLVLEGEGVARRIVESTALVANDAGVSFFGFNQTGDVRKFRPFEPFLINSWAGGVTGHIGRDIEYDQSLKLRADIDFAMQNLLVKRIVWVENRYAFIHNRSMLAGGNTINRSREMDNSELEKYRDKWGEFIRVRKVKTTYRLMINVDRQWNIKYDR